MSTTHPTLRRIHPAASAPLTVEEAYALPRPRPADRPWIGSCMISSLDGATAVDGWSTGLGNPTDLAVLHGLRRLADMILVGAATARIEGYGPPETPGQRVGVVTNSGNIDTTSPLFTSGAGFIITSEQTTIDGDVDVLRAGATSLDLSAAVHRLDEIVPGVRFVQTEGGAGLNGSLLDADLIDELDLTVSPRMVGGDSPRATRGAVEAIHGFTLDQLLIDDEGFVFGRWLRNRP